MTATSIAIDTGTPKESATITSGVATGAKGVTVVLDWARAGMLTEADATAALAKAADLIRERFSALPRS